MPNRNYTALLFFFFVFTKLVWSQGVFSPELGIIAGPVQFRSDYGEREDKETNLGNSGFGIGIIGFLNFSYRRSIWSPKIQRYFNEHFKIRGEISWNRTKLEHLGTWVDPNRTSEEAEKLRNHKGVNQNFNFGFQLEYSPYSVRSFESFDPIIYPYIALGTHYTFYTAQVSTTYDNPNPNLNGNVLNASNFYSGWEPGSVKPHTGSTPSIVTSVGIRYKMSKMEDLILECRGQYFFSDWVDGLNHQLESNKYNDWLLWLNVGYILYFE